MFDHPILLPPAVRSAIDSLGGAGPLGERARFGEVYSFIDLFLDPLFHLADAGLRQHSPGAQVFLEPWNGISFLFPVDHLLRDVLRRVMSGMAGHAKSLTIDQ